MAAQREMPRASHFEVNGRTKRPAASSPWLDRPFGRADGEQLEPLMRCEGGRVIGGWRPTVAREVAEAGPQRDDERQDRRRAARAPCR